MLRGDGRTAFLPETDLSRLSCHLDKRAPELALRFQLHNQVRARDTLLEGYEQLFCQSLNDLVTYAEPEVLVLDIEE